MYIVTGKDDNVIFGIGSKLEHWDNGYPYLPEINTAWSDEAVNVYQVGSVPSDVSSVSYCYSPEKGFYPNANWVDPSVTKKDYGIDESIVQQIKADYKEELMREIAAANN